MFVRLVSFGFWYINYLTQMYLKVKASHAWHKNKLHTSLGGLHMPLGILHQMSVTLDIGLR